MITSGLVCMEDGIKKAEEYAPSRKVRIELRFDVEPRQDGETRLQEVLLMAEKYLIEALHHPEYAPRVATAQVAADVDKPRGKPGRKPKTEPLPAVETFPGASDGREAATTPKGDTPASETKAANDFPDDLVSSPAKRVEEALPVISDKALYDMVMEINARIKKGATITAMAAKYCPDDGIPPSLKRIAEDKRAIFLAEVKAFAEDLPK